MAELVGVTISATEGSGMPSNSRGGRGMPRSGSFNTRAGASTIATDDIGHDVSRLYTLVETAMMNMPAPTNENNSELRPTEIAKMKEMLLQTWDSIREWLDSHPSSTDRQQAAMHTGQFLTTALHMVCKLNDPPVDVIESLIECAPETVEWPDSNGWLPLHHACANGASGKVLSVLVQAYPEGKVRQDKRFRTPLHFAFFRRDAHDDKMGNKNSLTDSSNIGATTTSGVGGVGDGGKNTTRETTDGEDDVGNSMPEIVRLLADSGAAELQDEGGMVSFDTYVYTVCV